VSICIICIIALFKVKNVEQLCLPLFCFAGIADRQNKFTPEKVETFNASKNWAMISGGKRHTVALDASG